MDKKILMIIASSNFRDEEYQKPRALFEKAGYAVEVASSSLSLSKGMLGLQVKPDKTINDVKVADYSAVVFVGGGGATEYFENKKAHTIAQQAVKENKVLGAICLAPSILARAGLLKDKNATVWDSEGGTLTEKGAKYTGRKVETSGKIITANGPEAAEEFGKTILTSLKSN